MFHPFKMSVDLVNPVGRRAQLERILRGSKRTRRDVSSFLPGFRFSREAVTRKNAQ